MVPLYFLKQEWGELSEIIIASPISLTQKEAFEKGKVLVYDGFFPCFSAQTNENVIKCLIFPLQPFSRCLSALQVQ